MSRPALSEPPARNTPRLFYAVIVVFVAAALVPTAWPALDLGAAGLFAPPSARIDAVGWAWVAWINAWVPAAFRVCLAIALVGWVAASLKPRWAAWRLPLAFVVLAGVLGPGMVVNWVFKDNWQRARPYQVENFGGPQQFSRAAVITDQCNNNCSFVSGHVACGAFLISLGLVHRRRRRVWAVAGVVCGLAIGFSRMAAMAHWFSDVLWAFPITLVTSWLVYQSLNWLYNRPSRTVG